MKIVDTLLVQNEQTGELCEHRRFIGKPFNRTGIAPIMMWEGEPVYSSDDIPGYVEWQAQIQEAISRID